MNESSGMYIFWAAMSVIALVWYSINLANGWKNGQMLWKLWRTVSRESEPVSFWALFVLQVLAGVFFMGLLIFSIFHVLHA